MTKKVVHRNLPAKIRTQIDATRGTETMELSYREATDLERALTVAVEELDRLMRTEWPISSDSRTRADTHRRRLMRLRLKVRRLFELAKP